MNSIFTPGSRCLLDSETEVTVLKAVTRSHSNYNVEVSGKRIETVSAERLTPVDPKQAQDLLYK